ncbi:hypothetical protein [Nonomuraea sp. NPDC003804]|uniref:hypothetical protein n=1 Tax=Nonomuraea sp. NPDC003804 TaxID=3154547 RepID=UPI00339EA202
MEIDPRRLRVLREVARRGGLRMLAVRHPRITPVMPELALLDVPEGFVRVSRIAEVGARRIEAVTRLSRTRSVAPDPVQAVVIAAIEEALVGHLRAADPLQQPGEPVL